jgi:hypothetical protein
MRLVSAVAHKGPSGAQTPEQNCSVTRFLVKAETNALRISAIGESTESWFLGSRRIGFTSGLPNECYRLLQVRDFQESVYLRVRVVAVQTNAHGWRLKPSSALSHGMKVPAEDTLEEEA